MNYTLKLAWRYIFSPKEKWISISALLASLGLMLGVATLIIVLSVMQGFRNTMLDKILNIQGHAQIQGPLENYEQISREFAQNNIKTIPMLESQFMAMHNKNAFGILAHGLQPELLRQKTANKKHESNQIIIGQQLAKDFQIKIGDTITLMNSSFIQTPFGAAPRMQPFTVSNIIDFGFFQYDKMLCLISLQDMQEFLDTKDIVSNILLFFQHPDQAESEVSKIRKQYPNLQIISWEEQNITFAQVLTVQRNVMIIVIALMIIIASFNGISSLMMLVKEKTKEIAILKVLGSSKKQILSIFMYVGLIISSISITIGLGLGLIISYYIDNIRQFIEKSFNVNLFPESFYHLTSIPTYIEAKQILYLILWCFILSMIAIIYPCKKALEIEPDSELRL